MELKCKLLAGWNLLPLKHIDEVLFNKMVYDILKLSKL